MLFYTCINRAATETETQRDHVYSIAQTREVNRFALMQLLEFRRYNVNRRTAGSADPMPSTR